jgi:hypothetical protein
MLSNIPPGTSDRDPLAPWNDNSPDVCPHTAIAEFAVTGGDGVHTKETFGDFLAAMDGERKPLTIKADLLTRTVSDLDLLEILLSEDRPARLMQAALELRARYLDAAYTQRVIGQIAEQHGNEVPA